MDSFALAVGVQSCFMLLCWLGADESCAVSACATVRCPALMVTAPGSGHGKTTVTAALAHWHRSQGRRVRVFKTGPDFLDPMVLQCASGAPVQQLDLWMGGDAHCAELLHSAAMQADLILVEGVMGLYDGTPCSADLALRFGLPLLAVIDASAMAQTFGAVAHGMATYRPGLHMAGVLANRVGSARHMQMLRESLPAGMSWCGALQRNASYGLPARHLGLVQAAEVSDMAARIEAACAALSDAAVLQLPREVVFEAPHGAAWPSDSGRPSAPLIGTTVAVARDAAFSFLYPANIDTLLALGARLCFFSPLANEPVPAAAHALYLPGGYPELHLKALASNTAMRESIIAHHAAGRPLVAECGGMLALLESLSDKQGNCAPMLGLLPGQAAMAGRLVNLGMHSVMLPEGQVRGHTFHYARIEKHLPAALQTQAQRLPGQPEAVFRQGRLFASFMHMYFPSNPLAIAGLFKS